MAEYYALSASMKEALPLRNLVAVMAKGFGLDKKCVTKFKTTVWEDNMGALTLANLDPGQNTPRSKFYDVRVHWFRSHLEPEVLEVHKVDTSLQLADLYTKATNKETFVRLRRLLCGW